MQTNIPKRLTTTEVNKIYNGRWVLMTNFVSDPLTFQWIEGIVIADAPPDDNTTLFKLANELKLNDISIFFVGENPYSSNFLL